MSAERENRATIGFLHEAGHLALQARQGWWMLGIRDPETVAEHSHRAAVVAYVLAAMEGADPDRTAVLALFHDLAETRLSDVPSIGKPYLQTADPVAVVEDQVAGMPLGAAVVERVAEFEANDTVEARLAREADKLELILRAREYQAQGHDTQAWIDSSLAAMRSESGRRLAGAACELDPHDWWRGIASSYGRAGA